MTRRVVEKLCPEKVCVDFLVPEHMNIDKFGDCPGTGWLAKICLCVFWAHTLWGRKCKQNTLTIPGQSRKKIVSVFFFGHFFSQVVPLVRQKYIPPPQCPDFGRCCKVYGRYDFPAFSRIWVSTVDLGTRARFRSRVVVVDSFVLPAPCLWRFLSVDTKEGFVGSFQKGPFSGASGPGTNEICLPAPN